MTPTTTMQVIGKVADLLNTLFSPNARRERYRLKLREMNRRALNAAEQFIFLTDQIESTNNEREAVRLRRKREVYRKLFFKLS